MRVWSLLWGPDHLGNGPSSLTHLHPCPGAALSVERVEDGAGVVGGGFEQGAGGGATSEHWGAGRTQTPCGAKRPITEGTRERNDRRSQTAATTEKEGGADAG